MPRPTWVKVPFDQLEQWLHLPAGSIIRASEDYSATRLLCLWVQVKEEEILNENPLS